MHSIEISAVINFKYFLSLLFSGANVKKRPLTNVEIKIVFTYLFMHSVPFQFL